MPSTLASEVDAGLVTKLRTAQQEVNRPLRSPASGPKTWAPLHRGGRKASEAAAADVVSRMLAWSEKPDDAPPNDDDQALRETVRQVMSQRDRRRAMRWPR